MQGRVRTWIAARPAASNVHRTAKLDRIVRSRYRPSGLLSEQVIFKRGHVLCWGHKPVLERRRPREAYDSAVVTAESQSCKMAAQKTAVRSRALVPIVLASLLLLQTLQTAEATCGNIAVANLRNTIGNGGSLGKRECGPNAPYMSGCAITRVHQAGYKYGVFVTNPPNGEVGACEVRADKDITDNVEKNVTILIAWQCCTEPV